MTPPPIPSQPSRPHAADADWWRRAVIYQIYPRSFQDTNGDGIGDLPGIVRRLDHIAALGADAIWISPFFRSPMLDFGYDVSDYTDVDPLFGTLADLDALVERAHALGLKVLIDLVLSHTSNQHPWFQQSQQSADNPRADWYVWADARPDGTPPNNWLSIFGGSAWEWSSERMQYYLHNFLREQPDLNFHNPQVQEAALSVARFWLERGIDGFRLDTINFYFHDALLRDNPPLPVEARNATIAPAVNPYNWQDHLHDKNRPENLEFLKKLRAVMDSYGATTLIGEVGDAQYGSRIQAEYTSGGDKVHMCYSFDLLSGPQPTAESLGAVLQRHEASIGDGWACWAFSNHDVVRHATRWSLNEEARKLYAALLLSLHGAACLYQGEELGLTEADVAFEDLQDPYGIRFWPRFKGRDGCRTPMPWRAEAPNGGFSTARPWLPLPPEHLALAVAEQEAQPDSVLAFYRRMLAFRRANPVLATGALRVERAAEGVLILRRGTGPGAMLCAFNLTDAPRPITLPAGDWTQRAEAPLQSPRRGNAVTLPPFGAFFASTAAG